MLQITGYQIHEPIYESPSSRVYRGQRERDGQAVILKELKEEYPSPEERLRYRQEYEITHSLCLDGVINAYSLEKYQHTLVIVFEDFGGQSLQILLTKQRFSLKEFLTIAIRITDSLAHIHAANIIHKDINPSNIVLNPTTGQLKLIDFGIATQLSRENPTIRHPNVLEGTLAYMSPEQTGRMNRSLDYRTDLYSLGVTLYELLTGQLPFVSDDPLELVHCHLAKMPVPPCEIIDNSQLTIDNSQLTILSDIIMKLLAKTAEDRYQSALGLHADLQRCLNQLQVPGPVSAFELGRYDVSPRLQIPETLYGRDQEVQRVLQAFERVRAGNAELLLVTGAAGVGKSSLVHEVHPPMTAARGFFMAGKFDQYQRHIPYAAMIQAFQEGLNLVLAEPEERLMAWKTTLLQAVGQNGKVLTEVLQNLELIIGPQPEIAQLGPTESQNRFNYVFGNFVKALARRDHPLVLFLDDLQWADSTSLNLLKVLMTDPDLRSLLCIGAYRDQEVSQSHPLIMTIEELRHEQVVITTILVADLSREHVSDLLSDTLHQPEEVHELAQVISEKTHGNAFFVKQFIHTLYDEEILRFDHDDQQWHWDLAAIQQLSLTDNVVELMMAKVQHLPAETHKLLTLGACIGNRFDLETLAVIAERSPHDTAQTLHVALIEGLLFPSGDSYLPEDLEQAPVPAAYCFAHDRIQEAAYALIPDAGKAAVHHTIGTLLRDHLPDDQQEERIFDIVNQLNWGRTAIERLEETVTLADLNLQAGRKAKISAAYEPALRYFTIGTELLPEESWDNHHTLTFELYRERYECDYLTAHFDEAEQLFPFILDHTGTALEKAEMYNIRILQYTTMGKLAETIEMGRSALELFDIRLPDHDVQRTVQQEFEAIRLRLEGRKIADLIHLPLMSDPEQKASLKLLANLITPTYLTHLDLMRFVVARIVNMTLRYGIAQESLFGIVSYGVILGAGFGEYQTGYEFGRLALQVSQTFGHSAQKCEPFFSFASFINHWRKPIKFDVQLLRQAFRYGLESGDLLHAGITFNTLIQTLFSKGEQLDRVLVEVEHGWVFGKKIKSILTCIGLKIWRQFILNLQGRTANTRTFSDQDCQESQLFNDVKQSPLNMLGGWCILKLHSLYLYEHYTEASSMAIDAEPILGPLLGSLVVAEHNFYYSLTLCALYFLANKEEKALYKQKLSSHQTQMKTWAENCPENFRHRYLLVEAELARIEGRNWDAVTLYRKAIEAAHAQDFIHHEALGNELLAKFWLAQGEERLAHVCLIDARYGYQLWGAHGKAQDLDQKYPQLLTTRTPCSERPDVHTTTPLHLTGSRANETLDFATVLKASQTISGEIVLDTLLTRVLEIASENAGADHGLLLFEKAGAWIIKAGSGPAQCPFPATIVNYVARTKTPVVLADAAHEGQFTQDPYVLEQQPKSVLCTPLLYQGQLVGILYLENRLTTGAFTPDRVDVLNMLSAQAAISIEHANLYSNLEDKVAERTQTLADTVDRLEQEIIEREAAEKALQTYREHLEDLVEERTAELTKAVTQATRLNEQLQQEVADRKRAEQTVRASEQQYRALAEHVTDGIAIIQECAFVFINEALCAMFGYKADRLLQIDPAALFREEYREAFRERCGQIIQGVSLPEMEAVCLTSDNREIWTEVGSRLIEWEGRPAMLMTVRDITERKLRERELEERRNHLYKENIALRSTMKDRYQFGDIVGKSAAMQEVYEVVAHASATEANVVIYGESGTGKELVAQTIHRLSERREQRFVAVNCGAIPENLFESEFFGHRKGAFTGANRDKAGFFDVAHNGTLFLDEVGELNPTMQVKLLRALESREYIPLGAQTPKHADVRIVAATNRNLAEEVRTGRIRQDFFYRINVVTITLPPLRERREDIPLLIDHVLESSSTDATRVTLPAAILAALYKYDWPGNIRELQNVLQRYLTLGRLDFADIVEPVAENALAGTELEPHGAGLQDTLDAVEKRLILKILEQHQWHRGRTAAALGITRRSLQRKMNKHGLM